VVTLVVTVDLRNGLGCETLNQMEMTMTDERMALIDLIEKQADTDLVREMLAFAADRIMELEVELRTGAAKGIRSPLREVQRNGYRERSTYTSTGYACGSDRAGDPQAAQRRAFGTLPSFLEPRRTAEKALVALAIVLEPVADKARSRKPTSKASQPARWMIW
jgi:hypothetical protein